MSGASLTELSAQRPRRRRRRRRATLIIPIIGAIIGFVLALVILYSLNLGGGGSEYPEGYFGDILRLSAEADAELAEIMPVEVGAACRDGDVSACRVRREHLRRGVPRWLQLRDDLFALEPPEAAAGWHRRYLVAAANLAGGFNAQFQALLENDRAGYLTALERTREASEVERALTDEFNRRFARELGG